MVLLGAVAGGLDGGDGPVLADEPLDGRPEVEVDAVLAEVAFDEAGGGRPERRERQGAALEEVPPLVDEADVQVTAVERPDEFQADLVRPDDGDRLDFVEMFDVDL